MDQTSEQKACIEQRESVDSTDGSATRVEASDLVEAGEASAWKPSQTDHLNKQLLNAYLSRLNEPGQSQASDSNTHK